jgi:hypothetical protein
LKEGADAGDGSRDDVEEQLAPLVQGHVAARPRPAGGAGGLCLNTSAGDDTDRGTVIEALGPTPIGIDEIIRHTRPASRAGVHDPCLNSTSPVGSSGIQAALCRSSKAILELRERRTMSLASI